MKERSGYEWRETSTGGYWVRKKAEGKHRHKLDFFCPYEQCRRICGTIDDKYLLKYGVCSICYVNYIENRKTPMIDAQHYREKYYQRQRADKKDL